MKSLAPAAFLLFSCACLAALPAFQEGEKLLLENKPREASGLLEEALLQEPANERIYLYLGIVYEQMSNPEKAIQVMRRGLAMAGQYRDLLYFNIGNNYFRQEQLTMAEEMYGKAAEANGRLASAYLNRANCRLRLANYPGALGDYTLYLRLEPGSPQRPQIEKLIDLLQGMLDGEARRREEEAQQQKALLAEVLNSLKNASENTLNLSAGSEQIEEKYDEVDISD